MENDLRRLNDERDRLIKRLTVGNNIRGAISMEQQYSKVIKNIAKIHWATGNPGYMIPKKKFSG